MLKKFALATAILFAGAVPAFAQDTCQAPATPPAVDGNTISRTDLSAAIKTVQAYIAGSDVYQQCIADYIASQKTAADANKTPVDPAMLQSEGAKVDANQASKQKAGDDINAAITAYKKAHPN